MFFLVNSEVFSFYSLTNKPNNMYVYTGCLRKKYRCSIEYSIKTKTVITPTQVVSHPGSANVNFDMLQ